MVVEWAGGWALLLCYCCRAFGVEWVGLSVGMGRFQETNFLRIGAGKRERKGRGKGRKDYCAVGERLAAATWGGRIWAFANLTLGKKPREPLAPNDDGHCPRDRVPRVR